MTWTGTRRGKTPEGEKFYQHVHKHEHMGGYKRQDINHEHPHRHHSLKPHRHVYP